MLKIETVVASARTEAAEGKTLKQAPAYRAPRILEVGKTSELFQGYQWYGVRDSMNSLLWNRD